MKTILFFVVLGGVLYASPLSNNAKTKYDEVSEEIEKEIRANVTELLGELNGALDKHIAIADDKSKSLDEKINLLLELRQENPKVYNVLWTMFEKFFPYRLFYYKRYEDLSENEKAEIDEAKKEVRAKTRKLIGDLSAFWDKWTAILNDKSKTPEEKNKAVSKLRNENPVAHHIFYVFEQFYSKRWLFKKLSSVLSKPTNDIEKVRWERKIKKVRADVTKLIGELIPAMDKQIAIADDKSKTFKERARAFRELRKENPKVYNVLRAIYEQFTPKFRHLGKVFRKLNDTEKEKVSEGLKNVRANVTKLIGEMRAVFDKGIAILDDKSKTSEEKMNALWELSKENSKANDILNMAIEMFVPRHRRFTRPGRRFTRPWRRFTRPRCLLLRPHPKRRLFEKLNETEKAELKKAVVEIRKGVRENVTKLIGELNEAMEKQTAIVDDQSKSLAEKHKALWELRKQNSKANNVLWAIFEQFVPVPLRKHFHISESLNETEKARWAEMKKEVRANATKLIGELNAILSKRIAILDDKSKTPREKLKALGALRKENPKAKEVYNVLQTVFEQFIPKRELPKRGPFRRRLQHRLWPRRRFDKKYENLTGTEKEAIRDKMLREVRANVAKIIGGLNEALDKQIAIFDDKLKTNEEKMKAFAELRKKNPEVYHILRFIFKQTAPKRPHFEKHESLSETEKAEIEKVRDEIKKEVRAKVIKIIGQLNAAFNKVSAVLDDKSRTPKDKLEALWALRKENPEVYDVLGAIFELSFPRTIIIPNPGKLLMKERRAMVR